MRRATAFCLTTLLAFSVRARAQEAVTEAEFLRPFEGDTQPAVRALGDDLGRAEAARARAGALANPRVEYAREHPASNPRQTTWTAAWTPPLDGRLGLAKAAATAGVDAARQRLASARMRLRAELREAYAGWVLALERREVLLTQLQAVAAQAERARHRQQAGEASGLDAQRLALAAGEVSAALGLAEADVFRREASIRAWRPDLWTQTRPVRPGLTPAPEIGAALPPQLEALRLEREQARLEARLAGRFLSFPELQAGWQRLDAVGAVQGGPVIGVAWSIPLFDRSQGPRREADSRLRAAEGRLALGESRAKSEVAAALAAYAALLRSSQESSAAAAATGRLVAATTAAFRAGEASVTDLLDTLQSVRATRLREIELFEAALEAHRNLEVAVGRPLTHGENR